MRVDKDKGYIDLSKRRASAEEVAACEERFNKSKAVTFYNHFRFIASCDTVQTDLI